MPHHRQEIPASGGEPLATGLAMFLYERIGLANLSSAEVN
jgi:hypothetical protein